MNSSKSNTAKFLINACGIYEITYFRIPVSVTGQHLGEAQSVLEQWPHLLDR